VLLTTKSLLDPPLFSHLQRILTKGAPALCVASSTEENYQLYCKYGNHPGEEANMETSIYKALVKEDKKGYIILANHLLTHFTYNAHYTPYGVVIKEGKKDRPFADTSFRPTETAMCVNDWTNKLHELPVVFQHSELLFFQEIYNLRISFPQEDIFLGDDDIQGRCLQTCQIQPKFGGHAWLSIGTPHGLLHRPNLWRRNQSSQLRNSG
jgi:hypothetical protein